YGKQLRRLAVELDVVDHVRFPGHIDSRLAYWASDVNALLSTSEGFGLVVVEGMLCGAVALRSKSAGGADQVEEGKTGLLVEDLIPAKVAEAISWTLEHPEELARMRDAAAAFSRTRFGLARMADQVEAIYEEAIAIARRYQK